MSVVPVPPEINSSNAKKFVTDTVSFLKIAKDDLSKIKELRKTFENINRAVRLGKSYTVEMANVFVKEGFIPMVSDILQKISQIGYFKDDDTWFTVHQILFILMNVGDDSYDFAVSILDTEIPQLLMSIVLHEPYRKNLKSKNIYKLLDVSLTIIYNIARHPGKATLFRRDDMKKVAVEFIRINDSDTIGIISMLLLANLVNESELHLLDEGKSTIKILIDKIIAAKAKNPAVIDGFSLWELINGLKQIAVNDNMKKAVVRENGINVIIDVLKKPTGDEDIEHSLGVIWNLCFDNDIRNVLDSTYKVKDVIKCYSNHKNSNIKKSYDGIIWLLDQKKTSVERVKSAAAVRSKNKEAVKWKFDVFLSYSWANKQDVFMIRDELNKNNLKVWIDVDQMKGSTLEAMADGIENARIFIMAVTEAYRSSPNCRTEAEYAFSLRKPIIPIIFQYKYKPSGWLGMIMGTKTYYEFSERRNFVETMGNLITSINTSNDNSNDIKPTAAQPLGHTKTDSLPVQSTLNTSVQSSSNSNVSEIIAWQKNDVDKWFNKCKLSVVKTKLNSLNMNGEILLSFIDMKKNCPEFLYNTLYKDHKLTLAELLQLNRALSNLGFP